MDGSDDSIKVAVKIRPLVTSELLNKCTNCVTVTPGEPQQLTNALLEAEVQKSMWLPKEKIIQVDDSDDLGLKHKNRKRNLADENEIIQVDDSDESGLKQMNKKRNLADEDEIIQVDDSDDSGLKHKNRIRNLADEGEIIQVDDSDDSSLKQNNRKRNLADEDESAMKSGLRV